jgi:hypothetical protein
MLSRLECAADQVPELATGSFGWDMPVEPVRWYDKMKAALVYSLTVDVHDVSEGRIGRAARRLCEFTEMVQESAASCSVCAVTLSADVSRRP